MKKLKELLICHLIVHVDYFQTNKNKSLSLGTNLNILIIQKKAPMIKKYGLVQTYTVPTCLS